LRQGWKLGVHDGKKKGGEFAHGRRISVAEGAGNEKRCGTLTKEHRKLPNYEVRKRRITLSSPP
jgi:hypothetical protein